MEVLSRKLNADRDLRKDTRLDMSLPLHIIGKSTTGIEFHESTITINISRQGLCTTLRTFLGQKTIIYLSLPMPNFLREYECSSKMYGVYAEVRHSRRIYANEWRVGIQFIGTTSLIDYEHYPQVLQNHLSSIQQSILQAKKLI
jgi:hypothetical protein